MASVARACAATSSSCRGPPDRDCSRTTRRRTGCALQCSSSGTRSPSSTSRANVPARVLVTGQRQSGRGIDQDLVGGGRQQPVGVLRQGTQHLGGELVLRGSPVRAGMVGSAHQRARPALGVADDLRAGLGADPRRQVPHQGGRLFGSERQVPAVHDRVACVEVRRQLGKRQLRATHQDQTRHPGRLGDQPAHEALGAWRGQVRVVEDDDGERRALVVEHLLQQPMVLAGAQPADVAAFGPARHQRRLAGPCRRDDLGEPGVGHIVEKAEQPRSRQEGGGRACCSSRPRPVA